MSRLKRLEERTARLEKFMEQERCEHGSYGFQVIKSASWTLGQGYIKSCVICDKTIKYYSNILEWQKAKVEYEQGILTGLEKRNEDIKLDSEWDDEIEDDSIVDGKVNIKQMTAEDWNKANKKK